MSDYKKEVLRIEENIQILVRQKGDILGIKRALTSVQVDRLFEINHEIEGWFERQSMLLPLIENPNTQDRWDHALVLDSKNKYMTLDHYL